MAISDYANRLAGLFSTSANEDERFADRGDTRGLSTMEQFKALMEAEDAQQAGSTQQRGRQSPRRQGGFEQPFLVERPAVYEDGGMSL